MHMQIRSIAVKLVTCESSRPYTEVIAKLDERINKIGSAETMLFLKEAKTKGEIVEKFTETLENRDFLHFLSIRHGKWVNDFSGKTVVPAASMYIFGNPFLAARIMKQDIRAGLDLPPRLLVMEKDDGSGTQVIYHLPSSLMPITENTEQKAAAEILDGKVEKLVACILDS